MAANCCDFRQIRSGRARVGRARVCYYADPEKDAFEKGAQKVSDVRALSSWDSAVRGVFLFHTLAGARPVQETLQKGVAAGGAATVIHVVYEQFLRGGAPTEISVRTDCVREILAGFFDEVPEGLAENLCALANEEDGQEKMRRVLAEYLPEFTPSQREILLKWLVKAIENV